MNITLKINGIEHTFETHPPQPSSLPYVDWVSTGSNSATSRDFRALTPFSWMESQSTVGPCLPRKRKGITL